MANTRDTLGDQGTVDALVAHTLTDLEEDGALAVGQYAFSHNTGLVNVTLPSVTTISGNAFENCTNLEKVDLSSTATINAAFPKCPKMEALILRSSSMCVLSASDGLSGTAIHGGFGAVYVPTSLVSTYKSNSNWSPYMIADINDYPITVFGNITDSWAEIKAAESNGTYLTKYSVGDTKAAYINGVGYFARIIGFDLDTAANSGDSAHITWMLKSLLEEGYKIDSNSTGNWLNSSLRALLNGDILNSLDCKDYIVPVTKTYYEKATTSTKSCTDSVWIPSYREVFGGTSYESSGCVYTTVFDSNSARAMSSKNNNIKRDWWLRSNPSDLNSWFKVVTGGGGSSSYSGAGFQLGVALGFCT